MQITTQVTNPDQWNTKCLVLFSFEEESLQSAAPSVWSSHEWLGKSLSLKDFKGKKKEHITLYGKADLLPPRVMLKGLGKKEKASMQNLRIAVAEAVQECREKGYDTIGFAFENLENIGNVVGATGKLIAQELIVAAKLSLYRCQQYKGKKDDSLAPDPSSIIIFLPEEFADFDSFLREAEAEANGVLKARDLVNGPANVITPEFLAEEASSMAKQYGFSCTVYTESQAKDMGMGAFCSVASGSNQEARFIVLEYTPLGKEDTDPFIVVGKGITFDTGGISLKPAERMQEMKGDMAGAGAVLGFFHAIGNMPKEVSFPRIIGLIPATENMPGGKATRPGDIVTTLSGQTVEVLNTDAEGRLILCDALTFAQKNWNPKALIDIATLTGACVIALGDDTTGLFTDSKFMRKTTLDIAEQLGELCWPLPMWDEYDKNIDSAIADIANVGPRGGGAIHAALFLRRFVEKNVPWAHLDIAGPGNLTKTTPLHPVPGSTGAGVRLFCHIAKELEKKK